MKKQTVIIAVLIFLVMMLSGCLKQKTSTDFIDPFNKPVHIESESVSFLKDVTMKYVPDPNDPRRMVVIVQSGSTSPVDALLGGIAAIAAYIFVH